MFHIKFRAGAEKGKKKKQKQKQNILSSQKIGAIHKIDKKIGGDKVFILFCTSFDPYGMHRGKLN